MTHLAVDEDEGIYLRHWLFGIWLIGFNARTHELRANLSMQHA